jgi:hypothetical protein
MAGRLPPEARSIVQRAEPCWLPPPWRMAGWSFRALPRRCRQVSRRFREGVTFVHVLATNRGSAEPTPTSRVNTARKGLARRRSTTGRTLRISCDPHQTMHPPPPRLCLGAPCHAERRDRVHQSAAEMSTEVTERSRARVVTFDEIALRIPTADMIRVEALRTPDAVFGGTRPTSPCSRREPVSRQQLPPVSPAPTSARPLGLSSNV